MKRIGIFISALLLLQIAFLGTISENGNETLVGNRNLMSSATNDSASTSLGPTFHSNFGLSFDLDLNSGRFVANYSATSGDHDSGPDRLFSMVRPVVEIWDSNIQQQLNFGVEVSSNTIPCRQSMGGPFGTLFFFSSDDNSVYGQGSHWETWNNTSSTYEKELSYTFYSPSRGWIATANTNRSNGSMTIDTDLITLRELNSTSLPASELNSIGLQQWRHSAIRTEILYDGTSEFSIKDMCKIVNEANTMFRQEGLFVVVEAFTGINANNSSAPNSLQMNHPDETCKKGSVHGTGGTLRGSMRYYETNQGNSAHRNFFQERVDTSFYVFRDDGTNHDGLNWNPVRQNGVLGCGTNNYYHSSSSRAGLEGVGEAWMRLIPSHPSKSEYITHHAILFAHELAHGLGAFHDDARVSYHNSQYQCGGDGTNNSNPLSLGLTEGEYHSIMKSGMPYQIRDCYGIPTFSDATVNQIVNNGAVSGLLYHHLTPRIQSSTHLLSEHGITFEVFSVVIDPSAQIDPNKANSLFWRAEFTLVIDSANSPLLPGPPQYPTCEHFLAARSNSNGQNFSHDSWQGYMGYLQRCDYMFFTGGNEDQYWPSQIQQNQWDYDGNNIQDDHRVHQMCSPSLTQNCYWVVWPGYTHTGPSPLYGPYEWNAITWNQTS